MKFYKEYGGFCDPGQKYDVKNFKDANLIGQFQKSSDTMTFTARRIKIESEEETSDKICIILLCTNEKQSCTAEVKVKFYYPGIKPLPIEFSLLDTVTWLMTVGQTIFIIAAVGIYVTRYGGLSQVNEARNKLKTAANKAKAAAQKATARARAGGR